MEIMANAADKFVLSIVTKIKQKNCIYNKDVLIYKTNLKINIKTNWVTFS
jgi:hypothetical protein